MPTASISKKEQKLEDALVELYSAMDKAAEAGAKMLRARLPAVMSDYALVPEVAQDLAALTKDRIDKYPIISAFKTLVNGKRKSFWEAEIEALNRKWVASGGSYLGDDNINTVLKMIKNGERLISGGAAVFSEALGITLDPSGLNGGLDHFTGGQGQIAFMAALAVVSGKMDWNLSTLTKEASRVGVSVQPLRWKNLPIDWRRGWVIVRDLDQLETGFEGYKKFSKEKADGAMVKGYKIASALLTKEEFRELGWGKQIPLQVEEVAGIQEVLRADLNKEANQREYRGIEGYKKFSKEKADGAMDKGYIIASALLTKAEFRELGWGKVIPLQVEEVAGIQEVLRADLNKEANQREYRGIEGYKKFSQEKADGSMVKGYIIASALLTKEEFRQLGWGKKIPLQVEEVAGIQEHLRADLKKEENQREYRGIEGYKKFSKEKADGAMVKGYIIASALLTKEEFRELGWGKQIPLQVEEVAGIQEVLRADLNKEANQREYRGIEGYKKFSKEKADGAMDKGYKIASALLTKEEFRQLGWGKKIPLQVEEVAGIQELLRADLKKEENQREYGGIEGYKKFSQEKAGGAMQKGYSIASALLTKEEFRELGWGKQIPLQVKEVNPVKSYLLEETPLSELKGLNGLNLFAARFDLTLQSALQTVRALLPEDVCEKLGWSYSLLGLEEPDEEELDWNEIDDIDDIEDSVEELDESDEEVDVEEEDPKPTKKNKSQKSTGLASWFIPLISSLGILLGSHKSEAQEPSPVIQLMSPSNRELKLEVQRDNPEQPEYSEQLVEPVGLGMMTDVSFVAGAMPMMGSGMRSLVL